MFANNFGEHSNVCCGLVKLAKWGVGIPEPIPLISVDVNAEVVHAVAQVEVTQVYVNKEEQPIEAVYYFPVNPEGAVTHFQAEVDGRAIKGTVKPQEEAKHDSYKAVDQKKTAFLGEVTKADIFKVRVGFLKPEAQVKVIIGYITEVKNEPGSNVIRFSIPTTIAPRYVSDQESDDKAKDIKNMEFSKDSAAPLSLKVGVALQDGINSIQSPTHKVKTQRSWPRGEKDIWHKAIVELEGITTEMDRDFVLNIEQEEVHKPRIYSERTESGSTAMMVHLVPSFKQDEQKTELIFMLDRSGSMEGQSIELAKQALLLFLHSMPADCYFNVIGFGSSFEFLFPASVKYDDETLKQAVAHARGLNANLGVTEILKPLKKIYENPGIDGYLRQIFILTDGTVSNTDGVIGIVQANAHKARVFALGIGDGASHHLVEGVAKAGGGTSAFATYNETIDKKVLNQLKNGLQPSMTEIELDWIPEVNKEKSLFGYGKPKSNFGFETGEKYKQSPKRIPPVYDGSQLLVFGLFQDDCPQAVLIKAQSPAGPLTLIIEHSRANDVGNTGMLHRLAAIKLIRELELYVSALRYKGLDDVKKEEERLKKEIIEISCRNGITSRYTSFVAVDECDKPSEDHWIMESRNVPSQFAHGWREGGPLLGSTRKRKCSTTTGGVQKWSTIYSDDSSDSDEPKKKTIRRGVSIRGISVEEGRAMMMSSDESSDSDESCDYGSSGCESQPMDIVPETEIPLLALTNLQSFNGSYTLDKKLADVLGKALKELISGADKYSFTKEVFATAFAVSFFEKKLADEKDVWELMVVKAKKWMAKEIGGPKVVDMIIQMASTFLGF